MTQKEKIELILRKRRRLSYGVPWVMNFFLQFSQGVTIFLQFDFLENHSSIPTVFTAYALLYGLHIANRTVQHLRFYVAFQ